MRALDASLIFVIFSHLTGPAHFDHHEFHVPKQQLVSMLQVLMQTGKIHLPRTQEAKAVQEELLNFELKMRNTSQPEMGALKVGTHDDLVCSLGLAVFYWEKRRIPRIMWF